MKIYRNRLDDFFRYVGEPAEEDRRNNVFLVISIIYTLLAAIIWFFKDSTIMLMLGYGKGIIRFIAFTALIGFSYIMFLCWLVLMNKKYWSQKRKIVTSKECWVLIKILFVVVFLILLVKDIFLYILGKPKLGVVFNCFLEISIAFLISWVLVPMEFVLLSKGLIPLCTFLEIPVSLEFVCLIIAILVIGLFFLLSKKFSHLSISWDVRYKMKKKLEQNGIINVKDMLISEPIERKIKQREIERRQEFDKEFEQTGLLFYVAMVFLLLIIPKESLDVYEKLLVEQFMGVATLAALLREVGGANKV